MGVAVCHDKTLYTTMDSKLDLASKPQFGLIWHRREKKLVW
jgi:hypothetical protein